VPPGSNRLEEGKNDLVTWVWIIEEGEDFHCLLPLPRRKGVFPRAEGPDLNIRVDEPL